MHKKSEAEVYAMLHLISRLNTLTNEYKPIPFWSWNDQLEPAVLRRQIRWMRDQGIGGFFMHARGGLKTPYLSSEWMESIEACCNEAEKLNMNAWIYDENGWPSGFAGGKLLEDPENRDMYITKEIGAYDPDADVSYRFDGDALVRTQNGDASCDYINLYFHRSPSTADILNPDVVKQFLDVTHEQYKVHFGSQFSKKITGFFTDEPQYYRADTPYTPMIAEYFRNKHGEDILDNLGLLFVEKEGYRSFRYRYWLAMQDLMLNSFAKQVYNWCSKNNIQLTGHYVEETSLGAQIMCCAGTMPFYEYEHIPGIDWLGKDTNNELSPRQLNSVAQQLDKKQALTETFACCGWNVTPAELKRIAGFQYACGANLMCHHLLPYSEHGQRKRDYPPHFNSINPWIDEHFRDFNDYFSRLGYLLSESQEPVNVAVLHPIRSAYLEHKRDILADDGFPASELEQPLHKACRLLSSHGIAYHFLDETLLEKYGFVNNNQIGCGQCSYTYLVLPKIITMGAKTEQLIQRFVNNGGKILLMDEKPTYLEGEPHSYDYLKTNCTLEDIISAQPFSVNTPDTELYCTYRLFDGKPFLFIQNASDCKRYTQAFSFPKGYKSFVALDLITMKSRLMPLMVTLEKNESLLLFPSHEPAPAVQDHPIVEMQFKNANAEYRTNFLTLDAVRYSKDGSHYSAPILCSDLCQQLLEEHYEGDIYLRYEFEIESVPNALHLLVEKCEAKEHFINGHPITLSETLTAEPCVGMADISRYIHKGINRFDTVFHWHQSEETYYALFGEGVTESLKNCIAYDSEIEAVYLAGHFGVYSHDAFEDYADDYILGQNFYIGKPPVRVREPISDGLPFFRGELTLTQTLYLSDPNIRLSLPGDYLTAKVTVNDHYAGELCFENTLDISPWTHPGDNEIRVTFTIGNRNLLGPFHSLAPEVFVDPPTFERNDIPSTADGHFRYKFRRFYSPNQA